MDRRSFFEVRREGRRLAGYAAVFNSPTDIMDFREQIAPGAFADSIRKRDIVALADHNPANVLARTKSGTLRLSEDTRGLAFDLDVPDTSTGRDILALADRNDLGGMSFGFSMDEERWDGKLRTLQKVTLYEISVVSAFPAYQDTSVQARSKTPRLARVRRYMETL